MGFALFNTLEYVKLLTHVGFSQIQAEGLNEAQMLATQGLLSQVATQADIKELRAEMNTEFQTVRTEFQAVRAEMNTEFQAVRAEMNTEFQAVRTEFQTVRAEIQACEHRLEKKIAALKPFVLKTMISIMLINLTVLGIGVGILALILKSQIN